MNEDLAQRILEVISAGAKGARTETVARALELEREAMGEAFSELKASGAVFGFADYWMTPAQEEAARASILAKLEAAHTAKPKEIGFPADRMLNEAGVPGDAKQRARMVAHWSGLGLVKQVGPNLRLVAKPLPLAARRRALLDRAIEIMDASGPRPWSERELGEKLGAPSQAIADILGFGVIEGRARSIGAGLWVSVAGLSAVDPESTPKQLRERYGLTRPQADAAAKALKR